MSRYFSSALSFTPPSDKTAGKFTVTLEDLVYYDADKLAFLKEEMDKVATDVEATPETLAAAELSVDQARYALYEAVFPLLASLVVAGERARQIGARLSRPR